jgi:DNA-binding transcriptional ArsR family regulator
MHEVFEAAARYFSVLGEPGRLKILHAICGEEMSVNGIIGVTAPGVDVPSRHVVTQARGYPGFLQGRRSDVH